MLFSFTGLRSDSWDFLLTDQGGAVFAPFSSPNAGLLFFLSGKVRSCPSFSSRFDYFFLTGGLGVLGGFSTDFVSRAFNLTQDESDQLLTYQTGALIVKLVEGQTLHDPCKDADHIEMLFDFESAKPSIHVNQGGSLTIATPENFPFLEKVGLSANVVKLDPLSMLTPCIPLMHPSSWFTSLKAVVWFEFRVWLVGRHWTPGCRAASHSSCLNSSLLPRLQMEMDWSISLLSHL